MVHAHHQARTTASIADLDGIDWPEKVKLTQRNWVPANPTAPPWISIVEPPPNGVKDMEIYTTRP